MLISSQGQRSRINWLHVMAMLLGLVPGWTAPAHGEEPAEPAEKTTPAIQAAQPPASPPSDAPLPMADQGAAQPPVHRLQAPNERMEMIVNTSRIVTLDEQIPKLAVSNPDVLSVTPLSPTEVQISAKKTGVTQVNLWSSSGKIYTVDVMVIADGRELAMLLRRNFPNASLSVLPLPNSVIISGNVDDATQVSQIIDIAEDFYPKVHNQIIVGGVQQVLLQVRVMEISRSKLRTLGVDFGELASNGSFFASAPSGLLKMAQVPISVVPFTSAVSSGSETLSLGVLNGSNEFFAFLNALRTDGLARVLAEPNLVTVSGRPAYFNVGGQIPVPIPQSLGTISIQYKPYGTQVDFVPLVLGNGAIRLEVRPSISQIDTSLSVPINGTNVPALVVREVDTGVEMRPGQTLAIAGLVQNQVETTKSGIPWLMDMPYLGALFRKNMEQMNEVELLVLVTPQLIEAMDPHEVPPCGPGMTTTSPTDAEFYLKGYLEVPNLCNPGASPWPAGASQASVQAGGPPGAVVPDPGVMPQRTLFPPAAGAPIPGGAAPGMIPPGTQDENVAPPRPTSTSIVPDSQATPGQSSTGDEAAKSQGPVARMARSLGRPASGNAHNPNPPDNRYGQQNPTVKPVSKTAPSTGFIGPVGYDVLQ